MKDKNKDKNKYVFLLDKIEKEYNDIIFKEEQIKMIQGVKSYLDDENIINNLEENFLINGFESSIGTMRIKVANIDREYTIHIINTNNSMVHVRGYTDSKLRASDLAVARILGEHHESYTAVRNCLQGKLNTECSECHIHYAGLMVGNGFVIAMKLYTSHCRKGK